MKFVWLIHSPEDIQTIYKDVSDRIDIIFICKTSVTKNRLFNILFRILFSHRLDFYIKLPFRRTIFKYLLKQYKITNNENTCFIFHESWYDKEIIKCINMYYDKAETIMYFDDTVDFYSKGIPTMDPKNLNNEFDYVFSYNKADVEKYNLIKMNVFFSKIDIVLEKNEFENDICFIGRPKDRVPLLKTINEHAISNKCKTDFIIVCNRDAIEDEIKFTSNCIEYTDFLKHEVSSNCILDIVKSGTEGETFRVWEAVYYNKKLLTNWKGIFNFKYYNPKYMFYFEKPEDIDWIFVKTRDKVDYNYQNDNSPNCFLAKIEQLLSKPK